MGVSPTRRPAARRAAPVRASTLPLPFVPAMSAPRMPILRVTQRTQQGAHATEAQVDAEPAAVRDGRERLVVGERVRDDGHSRVSSSS